MKRTSESLEMNFQKKIEQFYGEKIPPPSPPLVNVPSSVLYMMLSVTRKSTCAIKLLIF